MRTAPNMKVRIASGDLQLEGVLVVPPGCTGGAVICHPHPQYGGDMDNPVVRAVSNGLHAAGLATLRFNFRGVGASAGVYGGGVGEVEDAAAAVRHLAAQGNVSSITLAGYSFGAMVALQAGGTLDEVTRVIAVAPPLSFFDLACIAACTKPKLFVIGDRDQYCSAAQLRQQLAAVSEPKRQHVVTGADHFFLGAEQEVADIVCSFVSVA